MPEVAAGAQAPDEQLVALARGGDASARETLFHRHWEVSRRVAYRLLGNEQDALDAVQDAFLKAVRHLGDFDGRSGFRTWLIRIVTNAALDSGRRRKRQPSVPIADDRRDIEPAVEEDPALGLRQRDLRAALDQALDRLKPDLRVTFLLFAEAGLSYQEIADCQEIPIGTVMSRIYYARQKLQGFLAGVEGL